MINRIKWWFKNIVRTEVDLYLGKQISKESEKDTVQDTTGTQTNDSYLKDMLKGGDNG